MEARQARTSPSHRGRIAALIVGAALAPLLLLSSSNAATPGTGTVSESSPLVTWAGPQVVQPTASASCSGPNSTGCDNFKLTIVPPSAGFGPYQVDIGLQPFGNGDWDLNVFGPAGNLIANSGSSPGVLEFVRLINPAAGVYTVSGAPFAPAPGPSGSYSASATLGMYVPDPSNPAGGHITYANYGATDGLGTGAGEPSIGANWKSGRTMFQAGLQSLRVTWDDCSSPAEPTWEDVSFLWTSAASLDPIGWCDSKNGRYFASQLAGASSFVASTDDDGQTWVPSQAPLTGGVDHQSIGSGPFAAPLTRDPNGAVFPNAVYYCSQGIVSAFCSRSDTGGLSFGPAVPIYSALLDSCDGLHGEPKVSPTDGTVYVPNKNCDGKQVVSVSTNSGATWTVRPIPTSIPGEWDPSVAVAADGTVYFAYDDGDGKAKVAVSHNQGVTWTNIRDVGLPAGVNQSAFPVMLAGDANRAAVAFLGTSSTALGAMGDDINWPGVWYLYIAHTYDGGNTWTTVNATPNDPVQRGTICGGGGLGGCADSPNTRNLLDFNRGTVDKFGRVLIGYADGCISASCIAGTGPNDQASLASIARQVSGKRLFAQYDSVDVPAAPHVSVKASVGPPPANIVNWAEPDDHGSPITGYKVYRQAGGSGAFSLLATAAAADRSYTDQNIQASETYAYKVSAVNAVGEGPTCRAHTAGGGALEDPCSGSGLTVATDPSGDQNAALGSSHEDIQSLHVAGQLSGATPTLLFTMKTADLSDPLPPNTSWRTFWTNQDDGLQYFVSMDTFVGTDNPSGAARFRYGTFDGTIFSDVGAADDGTYSADGTIRITIATSKIGGPSPGDTLSGITGRTQKLIGAQSTGGLATIDSAGIGAFLVRDCSQDGPQAHDDSATTEENQPVTVDVLANDSDPNDEELTVVAVADPANGEATNNGDGTVTYRPDLGFSGVDSFSYTIRNATGRTGAAIVRVTVTPFCPPTPTGSFTDMLEPAAQPGWTVDTARNNLGPLSPAWQQATDVSAKSPTHSWFSDASTLDVKDDRLVTPPQSLSAMSHLIFWHRFSFENTYDGGVLEVSTDGGGTWTDVGQAHFVSGGYNGSISPSDGSPIAGRQAWTGDSEFVDAMSEVEVDLGSFAGQGVLVRFRLATDPLVPGSTPGLGWWIDDVQFTKLNVPDDGCNRPPVARDDFGSTLPGQPVTVDVLANDEDPDGDTLTVASVGPPQHGTAADNGDGTVTYTPAAGFLGTDTFSYEASDGQYRRSATVTISVQEGANHDPLARDDVAETFRDEPVTIPVLGNDTDEDGDTLTVDSVTQPAHGSVTNNGGSVTYTPSSGYVGADSFTYTAGDHRGGSDTATVSVTVKAPANRAPVANDDGATTQQDTPVTIAVLDNDTDADGDTLSVASVTQPAHGTAAKNGDGTVSYTPAAGYTGTDVFQYTVSDGNGGSDTASVTISVQPTGSSPGKVTGGGWVPGAGEGARSNFGFNAQAQSSMPKGRLTYDSSGISLKGTIVTLDVSSAKADFGGPCTLGDGTTCSYTVHVEDNGEPGTTDLFEIQVKNAAGQVIHRAGGTLGGGNIQIH